MDALHSFSSRRSAAPPTGPDGEVRMQRQGWGWHASTEEVKVLLNSSIVDRMAHPMASTTTCV